ncbi:MAG: MTH1187 family thiamine-binding protein [Spirochaetota bacterium]
MKVVMDVCVVPMGVGVSVSKYIVECQKIFAAHQIEHKLHSYGTNISGDYDLLMQAVKECHEKIHSMGAPRINTTIKLGSRIDRKQSMQDKIDSVTEKL